MCIRQFGDIYAHYAHDEYLEHRIFDGQKSKCQMFRICNSRDNEYRKRERLVSKCPFTV